MQFKAPPPTQAIARLDPEALTAPTEAAREAFEDLKSYLRAREAKNTERAYRGAFNRFVSWCDKCGLAPMPAAPETVAAYAIARAKAGTKPSTINLDVAAIRYAHVLLDHKHLTGDRTIRRALEQVRREHRTPPRQMNALSLDEWERIVDVYGGPRPIDVRNRAILCVGLWGALRRSEVAAIKLEHLVRSAQGLTIIIPYSKKNQSGSADEQVVYPNGSGLRDVLDPLRAVEDWIRVAGIDGRGPLFRCVTRYDTVRATALNGHQIYRVLKHAVARAGIDPDLVVGAHSMRVSYITLADEAGVSHKAIRMQSRHRTPTMIDHYTRVRDRFARSAVHQIAQQDRLRGKNGKDDP